MFRALRRQRQQAGAFLELGPAELQRRYFWISRHLGLEGARAAAYLAAQPSLLLAESGDAAAVVRWLSTAAGWRRLALRRNLHAHPGILLAPAGQLEEAAVQLQLRLDASVDELCLLLSLAPALLALPLADLEAEAQRHPTAWQLAAQHMERPPMLMREAAVSFCAAPPLHRMPHYTAALPARLPASPHTAARGFAGRGLPSAVVHEL